MNSLYLMSGPSGVGKTTIAYKLLAEMPNLARLVTYTTRPPRPNEVDDADYHFISREKFEQKIKNNELFEYDEHYGNYYGNSRLDLEKIWRDGKIALIVLDVNGVESVKQIFPDAKTIFILPDTMENLEKRIKNRPMDEEAFQKRWRIVPAEIQAAAAYDFRVVNKENRVAEAAAAVKKILES